MFFFYILLLKLVAKNLIDRKFFWVTMIPKSFQINDNCLNKYLSKQTIKYLALTEIFKLLKKMSFAPNNDTLNRKFYCRIQ